MYINIFIKHIILHLLHHISILNPILIIIMRENIKILQIPINTQMLHPTLINHLILNIARPIFPAKGFLIFHIINDHFRNTQNIILFLLLFQII